MKPVMSVWELKQYLREAGNPKIVKICSADFERLAPYIAGQWVSLNRIRFADSEIVRHPPIEQIDELDLSGEEFFKTEGET